MTDTKPKFSPLALGSVLFALTVLAYLPALRAGSIWGDEAPSQNAWLRTWGGLWRIWTDRSIAPRGEHYWPVPLTTFWIEYHLWGLRPLAYRLTNVLLHAVNVVLLWRLLSRLSIRGAWLAAALFALHPVHVEPVALVIERRELLSGTFYLAAFYAYIRFDATRDQRLYALSLVALVLAILSKSVAVTLPLALVLWLWYERGKIGRSDLVPLLPLFAAAVFTEWLSGYLMLLPESRQFRLEHAGALGLMPLEKVLIAGRAVWFYVYKLAAPFNLTPIYARWSISAAQGWQWLFPGAAIAALAALGARRARLGRGPLAAVAFFIVTLAPLLGFLHFGYLEYSFVADRFQYLASIGLIVLFAAAASRGVARLGGRKAWLGPIGAAILLGALGALTWRQGLIYESPERLWRYNIKINPKAWTPYLQLANLRLTEGRTDEAAQFYLGAIAIKPDYPEALNGLGVLMVQKGDIPGAAEYFNRALRVRPEYADVHFNLGLLLRMAGQSDQALALFERSIESDPNFIKGHKALAGEYSRLGRERDAFEHFAEAVRIDPGDIESLYGLGIALMNRGETAAAIRQFDSAVKSDPNFALGHEALARLLGSGGNFRDSARHARELLRIGPPAAASHDLLGSALHRLGEIDEAIEHFERALRLEPEVALTHHHLGAALIDASRLDAAAEQFREALRLDPELGMAELSLERLEARGAVSPRQ